MWEKKALAMGSGKESKFQTLTDEAWTGMLALQRAAGDVEEPKPAKVEPFQSIFRPIRQAGLPPQCGGPLGDILQIQW
jgi:hypothetical protein